MANVLVAGASLDQKRLRPWQAGQAALFTVAFGAFITAQTTTRKASPSSSPAHVDFAQAALHQVLKKTSADRLFRVASSVLFKHIQGDFKRGFLINEDELRRALQTWNSSR